MTRIGIVDYHVQLNRQKKQISFGRPLLEKPGKNDNLFNYIVDTTKKNFSGDGNEGKQVIQEKATGFLETIKQRILKAIEDFGSHIR